MRLMPVLRTAAMVQLARYALNRRRRFVLRRYRRQRVWAALGFLSAGGALWFLWQNRERRPAWLRKKERKEARRKAAHRARTQRPSRPAKVHVQKGASTRLKVPLGDQIE
jgi:hypothetical protein